MGSGIHERPKIVAPNGLPYQSTAASKHVINEMRTGIEEIIDMQNKNDGRGVNITPVQLQTIIIYELARTKQFSMSEAAHAREAILRLKVTTDLLCEKFGISEEDIERRVEAYRTNESDQQQASETAGGREQGTDDAKG